MQTIYRIPLLFVGGLATALLLQAHDNVFGNKLMFVAMLIPGLLFGLVTEIGNSDPFWKKLIRFACCLLAFFLAIEWMEFALGKGLILGQHFYETAEFVLGTAGLLCSTILAVGLWITKRNLLAIGRYLLLVFSSVTLTYVLPMLATVVAFNSWNGSLFFGCWFLVIGLFYERIIKPQRTILVSQHEKNKHL